MDLNDAAFLDLWKVLNEQGVRYILVGGFAMNFHGYQRFTGDVDIYLEDTLENRQKLRKAYFQYIGIDFPSFETIQFVPEWVEFPLTNGIRLDVMTSMVGVEATFDQCLNAAKVMRLFGVEIPVLHVRHLIANKKAVGRPKDQLDVTSLEEILRQSAKDI